MRLIPFTFRAIEELEPGPKWRDVFEEHWPAYRRWFLSEGNKRGNPSQHRPGC